MQTEPAEQFEWLFDSREGKPRDTGLTMVIGDGPFFIGGPDDVETLLETAGPWVDSYKLTWASLPFQPADVLSKKLSLLEANDVVAFTGGNFLEAAVVENEEMTFLESIRDIGCPGLEVSSTVIDMSVEEKASLVAAAADRGLHVHAEVGEKASETDARGFDPDTIVDEATACLDAGAGFVILETEMIEEALLGSGHQDDDVRTVTQFEHIVNTVGIENIMFEVPLAGYYEVMEMSGWFIETFGPSVNLGNVDPALVLLVEQQRRGIGPHSL